MHEAGLVVQRVTILGDQLPQFRDFLAEAGYDPVYGARPLRRAIQRYIEDPLSEELIRGRLGSGDIEVYLDGGTLRYRPAGTAETGHALA